MNTQKAKDIIDALIKQLSVTRSQLAATLGVSERALNDWADGSSEEMATERAQRLYRLADIVAYLGAKFGDKNHNIIRNILENGRIPINGIGDDDSISLISYICALPYDIDWRANTDAAILEYLTSLSQEGER